MTNFANMTGAFPINQVPAFFQQSSRFFFVVTDLNGHCSWANQLFKTTFQVNDQKAFDQVLSGSIAPASVAVYQGAIAECSAGKPFCSLELLHHISAGEHCMIYWEIANSQAEDGKARQLQWIGFIVQDSAERKKATEQVRQSELFFRALIADSLDGILLTDERGKISFSSASVFNILGYDHETLIGKNAFDFVHPDDIELALSSFRDEMIQQPKAKFIGIRLKKASGEWLWCMVRGHNQLFNPAVGKMLIYFCDDTFRRNTDAALLESRERFMLLIQNLNVGVLMCDPKGYILLCNQAGLGIFKVKEEELIGKSIFHPAFKMINEHGKAMPGDDFPVDLAARTKKVVRNVIVGIEKSGSETITWLQVNAQPVLDPDENIKHIICSFIDISEQRGLEYQFKQQEQHKQKLLMQATIDGQERERSEISQELHDNISQHLTTTRLYLEVAKEKTEGSALEMITQAHKSLQYINNEIRRLSQSLAPPELRDIGLVESIRDLCDVLKNLHAFKLRFDHHAFNEDKIGDSMKLMLFRIIQEQVNNIIRHADASTITIIIKANDRELNLSVEDNGKGYDPQTIKKGLGLINIINRVELFDGNVEIITSPGKGCFLQVRIPLR